MKLFQITGRTPVHHVYIIAEGDVVRALLALGADLHAKDNVSGHASAKGVNATPISIAIVCSSSDVDRSVCHLTERATGLRAARHFQWPQLEVVGESALILRQLRDYKPPKNPRLLVLYSQARRLADQIGVRHWSHHVRAHNKMADALANLAMDCRTCSQVQHPSACSGHCGLLAHLSNDIRPWMADAVSRHGTLSVAF
jgi:hypothetical protein